MTGGAGDKEGGQRHRRGLLHVGQEFFQQFGDLGGGFETVAGALRLGNL